MAENKETTTVTETDVDISTLLAQPGAESIMTAQTAQEDDKKPSIFQRKNVDLSFIDNPGFTAPEKKGEEKKGDEEQGAAAAEKKPIVKSEEINTILDEEITSGGGEEDTKGTGRPKLDKDGLYELTKKLIDKKLIIPFDDDKPLEKYTMQDFEELYEANDQEKARKLQEELPVKFFDSLPDKLKTAAAYFANGGTDAKGIFRALAEYEETASLDPSSETGQEAIARQYLQSTKFGTPDEIEEQINEWRDNEILEKKANQFKPKLDALQEQYLAYKVQEQENLRKQQQEQAQVYMENVYHILEPGELNGIKLDKKAQSMLYSGLVQPNYPSISGKNTNLLGHLLEKYQFIEPRHDLIAEALYLLADPEGYRSKVRELGKTETVKQTVRTLKTEESKRIASSVASEEPEEKKPLRIPRPSGNFFKR